MYVLPACPPGRARCVGKIADPVTGDEVRCAMAFGHDDDCGRGFLRWPKQGGQWYTCREYRSIGALREETEDRENDLFYEPSHFWFG